GFRVPTFGQPAAGLETARPARATVAAPYYLRIELQDKPGAMAKVAAVLGEAGVSIDRMRQTRHSETTAPVLFVTHKTTSDALDQALKGFAATGVVVGEPVSIRIEDV
ncbi:ACT domain-containing protein, partial [Rhodovulum sulfidophilum]